MSLETDMMSLCKSLHKEIISILKKNANNVDYLESAAEDLDSNVKKLLLILSQKENLDEEEEKELKRLHKELIKFYGKISHDNRG